MKILKGPDSGCQKVIKKMTFKSNIEFIIVCDRLESETRFEH